MLRTCKCAYVHVTFTRASKVYVSPTNDETLRNSWVRAVARRNFPPPSPSHHRLRVKETRDREASVPAQVVLPAVYCTRTSARVVTLQDGHHLLNSNSSHEEGAARGSGMGNRTPSYIMQTRGAKFWTKPPTSSLPVCLCLALLRSLLPPPRLPLSLPRRRHVDSRLLSVSLSCTLRLPASEPRAFSLRARPTSEQTATARCLRLMALAVVARDFANSPVSRENSQRRPSRKRRRRKGQKDGRKTRGRKDRSVFESHAARCVHRFTQPSSSSSLSSRSPRRSLPRSRFHRLARSLTLFPAYTRISDCESLPSSPLSSPLPLRSICQTV